MSEPSEFSQALQSLHRKRGNKQGMLTRLQRKVSELQGKHPDEISGLVFDDLLKDLDSLRSTHKSIQDRIDELVLDNDMDDDAEETEKDKDEDTYDKVKTTIRDFKLFHELWIDSNGLSEDLTKAQSVLDVNSPLFRDSFVNLSARCSDWFKLARRYTKHSPAIDRRFQDVKESLAVLSRDVHSSCRDPAVPILTAATTSSSPASSPATSTSHNNSSLHLDVPTFDGDPFKWANFETMFKATINARAKGHSNLEIKGHLIKAIQHPSGLKILHNLPDPNADLDTMLTLLRAKFGSPQVVCPLIINKIDTVKQFHLTATDLDNVYDNFVLPFQRFQSLVGDSVSAYLAMVLVSLMDPDCKREWLRHKKPDTVPEMETVLSFVQYWQRELANDDSSPAPTSTRSSLHFAYSSSHSQPVKQKPHHHKSTPKKLPNCYACNDNHGLMKCSTFQGMDVESRNKLVRDKRLCTNCFSSQHGRGNCPSKFSCRTCGAKHHSMLHIEPQTSPSSTSNAPEIHQMLTTMDQTSNSSDDDTDSDIRFLHTALVSIENEGQTVVARAVLDSGAAVSAISDKLASDLRLKRTSKPRTLECGGSYIQCKFTAKASLHSVDGSFHSEPFRFTVHPKLPHLDSPADKDKITSLPSLSSYKLADPDLGGRVDILLNGMDASFVKTAPEFRLDGFLAQPTRFGLCLSGPMVRASSTPVLTLAVTPTDLSMDLDRLWELDQVPEAPTHSPEDEQTITNFNNTYQRIDGRFSVSLPRVSDPPTLGDTRRQAHSRLLANEKSLKAKGKLDAFSGVLREYLDLGHAEVIPPNEIPRSPACYLPVHGVFKDSSTTTKVRVVFDASACSSNSVSLNDTLLPGPNLYPPLPDVLTRFRRHNVGMTADISKMFREILLNPEERDLHRFLMRASNGSILDCRMNRLTFGVKSSPFLATQVLHTLANLYSSSHPAAADAILSAFYVDDFLSGARNVNEAEELRSELCDLFSRAGMVLRKWRTNSKELKSMIPPHLLETDSSPVSITPPCQAPKALGIHWVVEKDTLHVSIPDPAPNAPTTTKRSIASGAAGVFDILGLFCPAIIPARILFQETWKRSLLWDKPVPEDIKVHWDEWLSDLPAINGHAVPRRIVPKDDSSPDSWTLHGFSDASSVAYGASIYLRSVNSRGQVSSTLVIAKARVLPVKPITIPKAELTGAHLLAKLLIRTASLLDIPLQRVHPWTDSEIVLHWLPKSPPLLNRFVANRVFAIQQLLPDVIWRHVRSSDNPADLASRGIRAKDLITSALWWSGPSWLLLPKKDWPQHKPSKPAASVLNISVKPSIQMTETQKNFLSNLWKKFSSFFTLVRVVAWILRCRRLHSNHQQETLSDMLTFEEIELAKHRVYALSQQEFYPEAFEAVHKSKNIPSGHSLHRFQVKIADHGHLLVCSRVRDPEAPSTPTTLIVLHPKSLLTKLLVRTLHRTYSHAGISAMASILANSYWIPGLRNLLKFISRTCAICQKAYAKPLSSMMGMLPSSRTTPAPPFYRTGVDFAGPFQLKVGHTRKPSKIKAYAVVFVCMTTKAVHLDLCASLSSTEFRATLDRFISRRGCPPDIFSDNGTNFHGAREEIRELQRLSESYEMRQVITQFSSSNQIRWHHIPPRAPHFGGLWEAAVKAMKVLLRKTLQPHSLRWDELYTLLAQAESILNSRPLAPLHTQEASEGTYLTAGHFLIGRPLRAPPQPLPSTGKMSNLRRWELVSRLQNDLWRQWTATYLASCAQRSKWTRTGRSLAPGDLVFVRDETLRSRDWPVAVVETAHAGDDGHVRAVTLRCRGKRYTRAIHRLIPLITDEDQVIPKTPQASPGSMSGTTSTDRV